MATPDVLRNRAVAITEHIAALHSDYDKNATLLEPRSHLRTTDFPLLDPTMCPEFTEDEAGRGRKGTRLQIKTGDLLDIAEHLTSSDEDAPCMSDKHRRGDQILVATFAEPDQMLTAWRSGQMGESEELCHRTTWTATINDDRYSPEGGYYSPLVAIVRSSSSTDHQWSERLYIREPTTVSILSMAALDNPLMIARVLTPEASRYAQSEDQEVMKAKFRLILQVACHKWHIRVVIGCGALGNQLSAALECFNQVMEETEFKGGWFEYVVVVVERSRYEQITKELDDHYYG